MSFWRPRAACKERGESVSLYHVSHRALHFRPMLSVLIEPVRLDQHVHRTVCRPRPDMPGEP